uniref:DUF559 domain-containing protein n=1 Tax=Cyanothece sp. (strain PCC 7425 / ATCC 29141) TaxID=395961 RepID=B8HYH4_CYAP4
MRAELKECASILVDSRLEFVMGEDDYDYVVGLNVYLSLDSYEYIQKNAHIKEALTKSFNYLVDTRFGFEACLEFPIEFYIELIKPEKEWQQKIKYLIENSTLTNQALITEKTFAKSGKSPIIYNEMRFASQSEVRIAQELESAGVLFFPLPLAVRYSTGNFYQDHREVDFLICHDGTWGILEVSYHQGRYEKDQEKDLWFKSAGVLFVQHFTAEQCYEQPKIVVEQFLSILSKHKR